MEITTHPIEQRHNNFLRIFRHLKSVLQVGDVEAILFLPLIGKGGAEKVALFFANALCEASPNANVLVVVTDLNICDNENFDAPRTRVLNLREILPVMTLGEGLEALLFLIKMFLPRIIHVINSDLAWQLLMTHGRRVRQLTDIYASIFSVQRDRSTGNLIGYAHNYLETAHNHCRSLMSDNSFFFSDALASFPHIERRCPEITIYNPVEFPSRGVHNKLGLKPSVLWAGRFDQEKRIDVVFETAILTPEFEFNLFGSPVLDDEITFPNLDNLIVHGKFNSINDIFEERTFDVFMFTSYMEGLPNIILEIGSMMVPIVAPDIGGISEIVNKDTGYILSKRPSPEEYAKCISHVISNRDEARWKAQNLAKILMQRHSWRTFRNTLNGVNGYLGHY